MTRQVHAISIIICTYNRADILPYCLTSLETQTASTNQFEVIIVNNNSKDGTAKVIKSFTNKNIHFRSVFETKQGLSHARNRGYQEAKYDWVSYVDDDAKAAKNYVERALWNINQFGFECIGGAYIAWHLYEKPTWLPKNFGTKQLLRKTAGFIKKGYASGGVVIFKKSVLQELGGFSSEVGMTGGKIAYGEETLLQIEIRKKSYKIGFDPELIIHHLVSKSKLQLLWHIKSHYAQGRDSNNIWKDRKLIDNFFLFWLNALFILSTSGLIALVKLFIKSDYYWQNAFLQVAQPLAYRCGKYIGYKNKKEG